MTKYMVRSEMLERVRQREKVWDFIIIGGGATGIGCAVDAASRGFDVLLLEQSDFGKGLRAVRQSWFTAAFAISRRQISRSSKKR